MKFEYLREFVAAAQSEELQECARELGLSPSVLSKHIRSMEQELDAVLFIRSRKTKLSPYGELLLPFAQELVKLQDEYRRDFAAHTLSESPQLILGVSAVQFRERSTQLIEDFMSQHPDEVRLKEASNDQLCQMVANGEVDMAFVRSEADLHRDPELVYMPYCSDAMVALLPPEHPLSHAPSISLEDVCRERIWLRSENTTIYQIFMNACSKWNIVPDICFAGTFPSYDMVRHGEGLTLFLAPTETKRVHHQLVSVPIRPHITSFMDIVFRLRHLPQLGFELLSLAQHSAEGWHRAAQTDLLDPAPAEFPPEKNMMSLK